MALQQDGHTGLVFLLENLPGTNVNDSMVYLFDSGGCRNSFKNFLDAQLQSVLFLITIPPFITIPPLVNCKNQPKAEKFLRYFFAFLGDFM